MTEELKPCRRCGASDFDWWNGMGTWAHITCGQCGEEEGVQCCDLLTYEERPDVNFDMITLTYPQWLVDRVNTELVKAWNTRAISPREQELEAALREAVALVNNYCEETMYWEDCILFRKKAETPLTEAE